MMKQCVTYGKFFTWIAFCLFSGSVTAQVSLEGTLAGVEGSRVWFHETPEIFDVAGAVSALESEEWSHFVQNGIYPQIRAVRMDGPGEAPRLEKVEVVDFVGALGFRDEPSVNGSIHAALPRPHELDREFFASDVGDGASELFEWLPLSFRKIFFRSSQCYQRAQVWAHRMFSQRALNTKKVFLFFTRSYVRRVNYKWWFHVAPFAMANGVETVLDPTFTDSPLTMKNWTDTFVSSHRECRSVETYQEYESLHESEDCVLIKVPMYYYQPMDIQNRDQTGGSQVSSFASWSLEDAYRWLSR